MPQSYAGFDWDDGNRGKCQQHGVALEQIEALFHGSIRVFPDPDHSAIETRYLGIGPVERRHILVAFTIRVISGARLIRPISARYMHAKEIEHYESQVQNPKEAP